MKITIPDRQVARPSSVNAPDVPLGAAGLPQEAAARGLASVGRVVDDISERIRQSRVRAEVTARLARTRTAFTDFYVQRATQADRFDSLVSDVEATQERLKQEAFKGLKDAEAQELLSLRLTDYFAAERDRAAGVARKQEIQHIQGQTAGALDDTRKAWATASAGERAAMMEEISAMMDGHVESGVYSREKADEILATFREAVTEDDFQRLVRTSPAQAVEALSGSDPIPGLPEAKRNVLLRQARAALSTATAAVRRRLAADAKSDLESIVRTGTPVDGLVDDIRRSLGEEAAAEHEAARARALRMHERLTEIREADPGRAREIIAQEAPEPGSRNFAQQQQFHDALVSAYEDIQRQRQEDPAASVLDDPVVSQDLEKAAAGELSPEDAVDSVLAAQDRRGIPPHQQLVLPKAQAQALANQYLSLPDTEKGAWVLSLQQQYGRHFGEVWREVVDQDVPAEAQLFANLAFMPWGPITAPALAEALRTGEQELKKAIGTEASNDIREDVAAALADYEETFMGAAFMPGRTKFLNGVRRATELLAMEYAQQMPVSEAVKRAADELVLKQYHFEAGSVFGRSLGYRVPIQYNPDVVARAAARKRVAVAEFDPVPLGQLPRGDDQQTALTADQLKKEYIRMLVQDGRWVTNQDETGLILVDPLGLPVRNAAGEFYGFRFDEAAQIPERHMPEMKNIPVPTGGP